MKEHGGLGDVGAAEVFVSALKHEVGDAEAEDFVGFFKEIAGGFVGLVEVFAHSYELGALTGKYESFHS